MRAKAITITMITLFLASIMLVPIPIKANAELHVGSGYPYTTISAAESAAFPGDTILVHPGTYFESVVVDVSDLTIKSTDGPSVTIVDAGGTTTSSNIFAFVVIASGVKIEGFTVKGGRGFNSAGILIGGTFPGDMTHLGVKRVKIEGNIIEDNNFGVYIWHSSDNKIEDNIVRNNLDDMSLSGGVGIIIWDGNDPTTITTTPTSTGNKIEENEIYDNDRWGIAIGAWDTKTDLSGTKIEENILYGNGYYRAFSPPLGGWNWLGIGIMYVEGPSGDIIVEGNDITINTAALGNAIWIFESTDVVLEDNMVNSSPYP